MGQKSKEHWNVYATSELAILEPILERRGYRLAAAQPHLKGERFLMQAATTSGGMKLILLGSSHTNNKVVIKATRDAAGQTELRHERRCREVLHTLKFAQQAFHTPEEIDWFSEQGFLVSIQAFIEQTTTFLERPLPEQFELALNAFKAQEGTQAATHNHIRTITGIYQKRTSAEYLKQCELFKTDITTGLPDAEELHELLATVAIELQSNAARIDQYCGFLTHTDFVPHNIRIGTDGVTYLLDHSSITFGNKYESWARFINFMTLYNPPLAAALTQYVKDNRTPEESESLRLMRLYRLSELMWYYQNKLPLSEGDLYELNYERVFFWSNIMRCVYERTPVPDNLIKNYEVKRDLLRSEDEKERQRGLH